MRQHREAQNISQQEAAEALDITQGYYSLLEHGKRHLTIATMVKVSSYLNIDLNKLFASNTPQKRERKTKRVQLLLKESTVNALDQYAIKHDTSRNDIVQKLIESFLAFVEE